MAREEWELHLSVAPPALEARRRSFYLANAGVVQADRLGRAGLGPHSAPSPLLRSWLDLKRCETKEGAQHVPHEALLQVPCESARC